MNIFTSLWTSENEWIENYSSVPLRLRPTLQMATSQAELLKVKTVAATEEAKSLAIHNRMEQKLEGQQIELRNLRKENKEFTAQHAKLLCHSI